MGYSYNEGKKISVKMRDDQSKETRVGMKDGNRINRCSVYPANDPYIYVRVAQIIV